MAAIDDQVVLITMADIDQENRYRKTPAKNIDKLKDSIDALGLLHPIVVLPANGNGKYPLVVGQRRMLACEKLGFDVIEARVAHDMDQADRLLAEVDENVCREAMTPSEANACRKARAELLAPLAEGNRGKGGGRPAKGSEKTSGKVSQTKAKPSSNRVAAEGTGYSGKTLEKVEKIEQHLANSSLPQEVHDFIQGKLDEINNPPEGTKPKVHPAFVAVESRVGKALKALAAQEIRDTAAREAEEAEAEVPDGPPYRGQKKAVEDAHKAIAKHFTALGNAFRDADNFDPDVTPEEVDALITDFRKLVNALAKEVKNVGA